MLLSFLLIAAAAGIVLILLLVYLFPARRLKEIILFTFLFSVVGVFLFIRFLQPERLVDPESFYLVMDYISNLQAPTSPLIPSQWAANAISPFLFDTMEDRAFWLLLLWSTGLAFVVMGEWVFKKRYFDAWSKAQEPDWKEPQFVPTTLDERAGAIHVPVADLDGDGRPDFVALFAQQHETVVAFLNTGRGDVREEDGLYRPDAGLGLDRD